MFSNCIERKEETTKREGLMVRSQMAQMLKEKKKKKRLLRHSQRIESVVVEVSMNLNLQFNILHMYYSTYREQEAIVLKKPIMMSMRQQSRRDLWVGRTSNRPMERHLPNLSKCFWCCLYQVKSWGMLNKITIVFIG